MARGSGIILKKVAIFSSLVLFLNACSETGDNGGIGDLSKYDISSLQKMVEDGELGTVEAIVRAKDKNRTATIGEYLLLADVYNENLNGVAAEVAIEKARTTGAIQSFTAVQMARALFLQQKFKEAKAELTTVQLTGKDGFDALLLQGEIASGEEDVFNARRYYELAGEMDPADLRVHLALSVLELAEGNMDTAQQHANDALELSQNNSMSVYILGAIARINGDTDAALVHLNKALQIDSNNLLAMIELGGLYIDLGRLDDVELVVDSIFELAPGNPIGQFYLAFLRMEEGKVQEAEDILLRTGDLIRAYFPATRLYGRIMFQQQKYESAITYLTRVLEIWPEDRTVRLALVDSLRKTGQTEKAQQAIQPLMASATDAAAFAQIGNLNSDMGLYDEAATNYARAAEVVSASSDEAAAHLLPSMQMREAISQYRAGNVEDGISKMEELASKGGASSDYMRVLANMHTDAGNPDGALTVAKRLKKNTESAAVGFNAEGVALYYKGDYEAAVIAYSESLKLQPGYPSALKNRASAYMIMEKFDLALADLNAIAPSAPEDGHIWGMMGIANAELGNFGDAIRSLIEARKRIPASARFAAYHAFSLGNEGYYEEALKEARVAQSLAADNVELIDQLADLIEQYRAELEKNGDG